MRAHGVGSGESVPFACTVTGTVDKPALEVAVVDAEHISVVRAVVERMFVTAPEPLQALMSSRSRYCQPRNPLSRRAPRGAMQSFYRVDPLD